MHKLLYVPDEKYPDVVSFCCAIQGAQINAAACDLAMEVANTGNALVAGCMSRTPCYMNTRNETEVKAIFKKQMDDFLKKDIDFFIVEVTLCYKGNG